MNDFCARLPVDPHCPLLHTLSNIVAQYTSLDLFYTNKNWKYVLESFCEESSSVLTIESLGETGGFVRLEKHNFCAKYKERNHDWLDKYLQLFVSDVKFSSVTGHYATDSAKYLEEILEVAFAAQERGLDLKFRLKRADWLLKEVRRVISPVPLQKIEEEGGWLNVIVFLCLAFLFLFIQFNYLGSSIFLLLT